ncbi:MAG: chromosome segregation protein SMC, partial [Chloroflexi bacterium]|nr:chromosome segregation protein SMC [Chloroflexota bacterium]
DLQARRYAVERELLQAEGELRRAAEHAQALAQQAADEGLVLTADGSVQPVAPAPASAAGPGVVRTGDGADVDPETLRRRITELRTDIRALGPVNLEALDDLSEERERHGFLTQQIADLEAAETELRAAIRDLERLIRERFDASFAQVNVHFGTYFRRFFGGGHAELRVVEADKSGGEAGVEIQAQPPGKRIASLAVLSGGERALTSVALLFALLAVNPAPVCVLDEVDAALDEANVGRFVETLGELTVRSQFIVITHNRRTVEAADTIYGVSMGEDSASQLLSLRVGDAVAATA